MALEWLSPCKVNLLLNVLGKRSDGFHELETLLYPVALCDRLEFRRGGAGVRLTCSHPALPTDGGNLVYRAATRFLQAAGIGDGVSIHLEKRLPLESGLGGGSANAAATLLGLSQLFDRPLDAARLQALAAELGSDVPFFLQDRPAIATGRGEQIERLEFFPALAGRWILVVHPGFGVPTPWAYRQLAGFPAALQGEPGRARRLARRLATGDLHTALPDFYNALEGPVLVKYPLLGLIQEFLREQGALVALMSGSGSACFALLQSEAVARRLPQQFRGKFGDNCWAEVARLD